MYDKYCRIACVQCTQYFYFDDRIKRETSRRRAITKGSVMFARNTCILLLLFCNPGGLKRQVCSRNVYVSMDRLNLKQHFHLKVCILSVHLIFYGQCANRAPHILRSVYRISLPFIVLPSGTKIFLFNLIQHP